MESLNLDFKVMKLEDKEKKYALMDARDTNNKVLTYLNAIRYAFLDYIDGNLEDDPEIAYVIIEEFLEKAISSTIEISQLLEIEAHNKKQIC